MVGLSSNPNGKVMSYGEYLLKNKQIDKNIVSITQDTITFGAYDQSTSPVWNDFQFDSVLNNWAFKTQQMKVNNQLFLNNETLVVIQNFVPGTYIWTTN